MIPDLDRLAATLLAGGVALFPTDTIYGLHALGDDAEAVDRIAALKGREESKPFLLLIPSLASLEQIGAEIPQRAREALHELWPGPLTVIIPLSSPIAASRGQRTIGVRLPDLDWLRRLLARTGPLASTSANRSGDPPLRSPAQLSPEMRAGLDSIIDLGPREGRESVIVDLTSPDPRLIRAGEESFTQKVWKTLRKSL